MPILYDMDEVKKSYNQIVNSKKSESQKYLESRGYEFDKNGNIVKDLIIETSNGRKNLGKVSYDTYTAIEKDTLDSYKPKSAEEKNIVDQYRLYTGAELTKKDGSSIGFVSKEGLKAIEENNTANYTPINEEEKKTINTYVEYATKERQSRIDKYKESANQRLDDIEVEKNEVVDDRLKLQREKAVYQRSRGLSSDTKWKTKDTRTGKEKREGKPIPSSEGDKELQAMKDKEAILDAEADSLVDTINHIDKYANIRYNEKGFWSQSGANYTKGRLSQDTAQAYNDYVVSQTDANKLRADALSALSEQFEINNKNAFTREDEDVNEVWGTVRDWVAGSFATYLPQLIDQTVASIEGATVGAIPGAVVGSAVPGIGTATGAIWGARTGWVAGASKQMYETTRGMVYKNLIDAGYDEETALKAANDEAFISSIIEGAGEIVSMATLGGWKIVGKTLPKVATKVSSNVIVKGTKEFTKKTGKAISKNVLLKTTTTAARVYVNALSEYAEEYSQEAVSIANERRLKNSNASGKLNLTSETISLLRNMDEETAERLHSAGTEGFRIGLMMGGTTMTAKTGITHTVYANKGANIKKVDTQNSGTVQNLINKGLKMPKDSYSYKLAKAAQKKGESLSNYDIGKLYYTIKEEQMSESPTVSVGETFVENGTGKTIKVVSRDTESTTVEITVGDKTETKVLPNDKADELAIDDKYVIDETSSESVDTSTENVETSMENTEDVDAIAETQQFPNEETKKVYDLLVGEKLTNKGISDIINTPELRTAFEQLTGIKLKGSKAEQRGVVRNFQNNDENIAKLKQMYGGESENSTTSGETTTDTETTSNEVTDVTEEEILIVADAINETLEEGALDAIFAKTPSHIEKSIDSFAERLIKLYKVHRRIDDIADFFTDGGERVISALESVVSTPNQDVETSVETSAETTTTNATNQTVVETQSQNVETSVETPTETVDKTPTETKGVTETTPTTRKSNTVAYTNDNQKIDMVFKVVSADDLVVSNELDGRVNNKYPQILQPRDRSRVASQNQIQQMSKDLNPERLGESTSVSEGAPIVGSDNVVESGNGRTLAIKLAYQNGSAEAYRNHIINNAESYGIDVSNLPKNPILVRERLTEVDRVEFVRKANESTISSMSATEQARVDAEKLTKDILNLLVANDDGNLRSPDNKDFISAVVNRVFKNEDLNNVVNAEGNLSARGLERITNAIFYKAYGDVSLSVRLSESLDNDMKNATKVLLNIAPRVVSIKNDIQQGQLYNFDFSTDVAGAVRLFEKCRNDNKTIEEYANQQSMFEKEDTVVLGMAYVFETKNRGAKQATEFYNLLLDTVEGMGSPDQLSLGIVDVFQTKEEIFNEATKRFNNREESTKPITIPESISRSESEEGRNDDRRGTDEILQNNSSENEEIGNAVGIQQDNRRNEETRTVANDEQLRQENESVEGKSEVTEETSTDATTVQKYVSGNNGTKDGAIINELGNSTVVKALERDKSDVGTATTKTAGQTIEMDNPVEIVYLPNNKGKDIYATYFMQTKDSRGGQIASINTLGEGAGFDSVFGMDFVNETGFMETANGKSDVSTTQMSKNEFGGNIEVVKQLLNQIFENATSNGIRGQITYTMDNIDVNAFNDVSCSLFSEVSKYLPKSIKSKLGFKSQSFGSIPRYIGFAGVNPSVDTKNAINIDNIETASGKYIDVINELFNMSEEQRNNVLDSITQMPTTVEQLHSITNSNATTTQSTTVVENTKQQALESEANGNEEKRTDLLPNNGRRGDIGSTKKQTQQIQSFERKNQGKNETERRKFGKELIRNGQVENVNDGTYEYSLVKPEAYNDDMRAMVEEHASKGVELGFIVGNAIVTDEDGDTFEADGIQFAGSNKILVRYDGVKIPQRLAKHETIHSKWFTPKVQKIVNKIISSLTEADKQKIVGQDRYEYYKEIYDEEIANGDDSDIWQEFVCDVMAGLNDYTAKYIDIVNEYWYDNEEVKSYDPSTYTEKTDAGGNKYSFSSLGFAFFGNEDITSKEFEKMVNDGSYKKQKGYRDYVKSLVNVYKQSRGIKGMLSGSEVRKIEKQIEGILKVAIAAKKAGYDIYDDGKARTQRDSKNRLLFSSLEPNSDYVTSSDIATICDKRTNFSEIYDEIVRLEESRGVPANKRFFKNVDNYFILHKIMADKGLTIPCEECYVESMRKNLGGMAQAFIDLVKENDENNKSNEQLYHQKGKDKGKLKTNNVTRRTIVRELLAENDILSVDNLTVEMLTTAKGLTKLRLQAPLVYEQFNAFYGQAKPKLTREATPFRPGELIALLTKSDGTIDTALIKEIVATGGFRLQSYSDFQIKNFVDVIQTIFEAGMLGLNGHAYTKVPAFLEATKGTNLKRNISIFMYEDGGNWVLDKKNSFPKELEDIYTLVAEDKSGNTSIIAVSQNADMSAWIMANDKVGYGIPFHKSGLKMDTVRSRTVKTPDGREILGYANEIDHTKQQSEVYKKTVSAKEKANTKVKKPINIYQFWDFKNKDNLSKKELIEKNVKKYIDECEKRNYRPKFRAYVMNNGKVLNKILEYSKELGFVSQDATIEDISFKHGEYTIPYGYYKFIGDFGMFKPDGSASSIETLSLENYGFDKAVDFFKDSSKLRQNELLQQLENGKVREQYREMLKKGELTIEQLDDIIKQKRSEVVQDVVGNRYSVVVKDKKTIDFLENQEHITTYKAMQLIDGELHPPMAAKTKGADGKYHFGTPSKLGSWQQSVEDTKNITKFKEKDGETVGYYTLNKGNGKSVADVAYAPYEHSSNLVINDQFEEAHNRDNLVVVECKVPVSEMGGAYKAKYAHNSTGVHDWKKGDVGNALAEKGITRKVYLTRWLKPVRILSDSETAKLYKEALDNTDISVPFNVVTPSLLSELEKIGVSIDHKGSKSYKTNQNKKSGNRYSVAEESYAPTFYSKMGKVIDEMKEDKIGAKDVINYLTDKKRGVKDEEIKWSGIEEFLEGKKSVTKAELQEFVANNQLQIEEIILDNNEIPYTEEQAEEIDYWSKKMEDDHKTIAELWKESYHEELPEYHNIMSVGDNVLTLLQEKLFDARDNTPEGKAYKKAIADIKEMVTRNDDFGFDSVREALSTIARNPKEFAELWDMDDADREIARHFAQAQESFRAIDFETLKNENDVLIRTYAERMKTSAKKINNVKSEHYKESAKHMSKWGDYTLEGGENYREIVFKMPDSTYSNDAMYAHWNGTATNAQGVIAHARIQDFDVNGEKMLFIEEIQSDWHNEGHKKNYESDISNEERRKFDTLTEKITKEQAQYDSIHKEKTDLAYNYFKLENMSFEEYSKKAYPLIEAEEKVQRKLNRLNKERDKIGDKIENAIPDAPFRNNYHEYVLKRLIRMAAEQGYDSIGWTPADIQSERWSDEYAEGYRIEYDQDIPKFLKRYGKKWGAKVGKTPLDGTTQTVYSISLEEGVSGDGRTYATEDEAIKALVDETNRAWGTEYSADDVAVFGGDDVLEVVDGATHESIGVLNLINEEATIWTMPITDSMKESVLYEGQARYSLASNGRIDLDDLWAEDNNSEPNVRSNIIAKANTSHREDDWVTERNEVTQPKADTKLGKVIDVAKKVKGKTIDATNKVIDTANKIPNVDIPNIGTQESGNIADIVNEIRGEFEIPVATGKVTVGNASGIYKVREESIRTKVANNLPTILHELGHHLDKLYGLSKLDSVNEVRNNVSQEFLDQYSEAEKNGEAVAEFVRTYLKNTNEAYKLSPDFYADFVKTLSKEDLKVVNAIADATNEYMSSTYSQRVQSSIVSGDVKQKTSLLEKAKKAHADWIDGFLPIKDAVEYVEETKGKSLSGSKNAYMLATNHLNARAIANFNTVHGFRDLNGNIVNGAKSYIECIANVKKQDLDTFGEYLVLRHAPERLALDKQVFADSTLENPESIQKRVAEIEKEHPEMKEAAENLYEYQRNILKYIVMPVGGMTAETFNTLYEKYPSYVPFYRAIGKDGAKTKGSFANQRSPIKRAKGSGELIINPLESIIKNTDKMVKFALRNQTMQVLASYADTVEGFAQFMEKVPPDMIPRTVNITQQKEKFADALQQIVSSSDDYFEVSGLMDEIFGDSVTEFSPIANSDKHIVTVMRNGKFDYYQIHDEDLYSAIAEFTPKQLEGIFAISNRIMQPMKLLITQSNLIFATTNIARDVGTAYKLSQINNPLEFAAKYVSALKVIIQNGDIYKQYQAMGGGHNSELSANIDQLKRTLRKVSEKDMGKARRLLSALLHPVQTAASINDYVESIPRVMEFIRTLEANGDLQEAIYNADDITTNFKRSGRGQLAKQTNAVIMFNNAALQGLDKTYRTLTNNDKSQRNKTLLKWALTALTMASIQAIWNSIGGDDDDYENLSSYKKNNFYNFAIGDGKFISIPKARDTALLDSFTERTIEYVFGNDEAWYGFGSYLAQQLLPPMLPNTLNPINATHDVMGSTVLGGIADIGWNKNYMDVPIEGEYDKYSPSNERYNEKTSAIAYGLGQTKLARSMDLSPKKIDHLISSYTGIFSQLNKAVLPKNGDQRDLTLGLKNKFISDSNYSTDLLNKAYDNTDKAKLQWQNDNNVNNAIEYEQNATVTSYISGMNKAIKALPADKQREGRKHLLKTLNAWNYDMTTEQTNMISKLKNKEVDKDYILEELPSSKVTWTYNKEDYEYQMTPQEYNTYVNEYLKTMEDSRKKYGYEKAKEQTSKAMQNFLTNAKTKWRTSGKATKVSN